VNDNVYGLSLTMRKISGMTIGPLVRGDNETTIVRIIIPRMSGGVDLADLAWMINIKNAEGATDVIVITDAEIDDKSISFEWLPGGVATSASGQTQFWVEGVNTDGLVWQSGTYILRFADKPDAAPSDADTAALTELQQLIVYVDGALNDVLEAGRLAREAYQHPPIIGHNGNWHTWDAEAEKYVDTGKPSQGGGGGGQAPGMPVSITINGQPPDENGNFIVNTLTDVEIAQLRAVIT